MLKQRKRDDDDDFDERGVLKDGRQMRVPMSTMDARPPDVAKHSGRLHDGSGNHQLIHHQPGFIVSDGFTAEERQRVRDAYEAYARDLKKAWQRGTA
jgi:hypothetical protein